MPENVDFKTLVVERIRARGLISFAEFMELALYHPEYGYYAKQEQVQDYYTSVDVHPVFGSILAQFFINQWKEPVLTLIELGCGRGKLAYGILKYLSQNAPKELWNHLRYVGVEISPARRKACQEMLKDFSDKISVIPEFNFQERSIQGIIFSNEFFDALPFHRIKKQNGRLQEIKINSDFKEVLSEPSPEILDYFQWLGHEPVEGAVGEAHLECRKWMEKISRALKQGLVLTIDYGYEVEELYADIRAEGTALCHFQNQAHRDFYNHLGDQDVTAHVNFTTLRKEAEKWALRSLPLKNQSQFLLENGLENIVESVRKSSDDRTRLKTTSAIKSLIHPEGMGGTFKILMQTKS